MKREELNERKRLLELQADHTRWFSQEEFDRLRELSNKMFAEHPLPPAEGAEQRIRVRNILQDFYRRGEYELEQAEEDIMRLFQQQPTAEGAEEIEAELRGYARDIVRLHKPIMEVNPQLAMDSIGNDLVKMFNRLAQRIADKMVEKMSPSNEQIHEAALAWARDHSEAPDKDCPDWLIRDYEAGAYFVRQCYGCWNKTDKTVEERLREEYKRGIEDGKIIGKHGSVSFIE